MNSRKDESLLSPRLGSGSSPAAATQGLGSRPSVGMTGIMPPTPSTVEGSPTTAASDSGPLSPLADGEPQTQHAKALALARLQALDTGRYVLPGTQRTSHHMEPDDVSTATQDHAILRKRTPKGFVASCKAFLKILGPGLIVCIAGADGANFLTAAASGAQYGYEMLLAQLVLIPVLYFALELTVRLGAVTRKGFLELIREEYLLKRDRLKSETHGKILVWFLALLQLFLCGACILSEMSCIVQIGELWGIPRIASGGFVWLVLVYVVLVARDGSEADGGRGSSGKNFLEKVAIFLGCFECVFLVLCFMLPVDWGWSGKSGAGVLQGLLTVEFTNMNWDQLLAANVGSAIVPWMLCYQQSAIAESLGDTDTNDQTAEGAASSKKDVDFEVQTEFSDDEEEDTSIAAKTRRYISHERLDTVIGCFFTQIVVCTYIITIAALPSLHVHDADSADGIGFKQIVTALGRGDALGSSFTARLMLSLGIVGCSLVTALVVSVCPVWVLGEALGEGRKIRKIRLGELRGCWARGCGCRKRGPAASPVCASSSRTMGTTSAGFPTARDVELRAPMRDLEGSVDVDSTTSAEAASGKEDKTAAPWRSFDLLAHGVFLLINTGSLVIAAIPGVGDSAFINIQVEILNCISMPVLLYFLWLLCSSKRVMCGDRSGKSGNAENAESLGAPYRLGGWYKWMLAVVFAGCAVFSVFGFAEGG